MRRQHIPRKRHRLVVEIITEQPCSAAEARRRLETLCGGDQLLQVHLKIERVDVRPFMRNWKGNENA
jgi:hypothetical protein